MAAAVSSTKGRAMTTTDAMKAKLADLVEMAVREWVTESNRSLPAWRKQHCWRTGADRIEITIARPDLGQTAFDLLEIHISEKKRV
jgi:hypothetical protein